MERGKGSHHFLSTLIMLSIISLSSASLSTYQRWIVSPSGNRAKLRCVSWAGHLHAMVPEGLNKQPIKTIAQKVKTMGFNCVRLTWAVHMYAFKQNVNLTVEQSIMSWNLTEARDGIEKNNPDFLTMTIADAQKAVIDELGANNMMVILDNHVSLPIWCCGYDDGNGFFGDKFFNTDDWLKVLGIVADRYKGHPAVVGMSLRNGLRGPSQNEDVWYGCMQNAANYINRQNPDLLIIVSGLNFSTDLSFLKDRPFLVPFKNKLVFEAHAYVFDDPLEKWKFQTNGFCGIQTRNFVHQSGFLESGDSTRNGLPLFLSEFGVDLKVEKEIENYFLACMLAYIAETDLDWGLWSLQGSYMLREGQIDVEENYGILDKDWENVKNPNMLKRLQFIQQVSLDHKSDQPLFYKMFHPQSGMCVQADDMSTYVYVSECSTWAKWIHDGYLAPIKLSDGRCLSAVGDGQPLILSNDCSSTRASWKFISGATNQIGVSDEQGNLLCLEWDDPQSTRIIMKKCLCVDEDNNDLLYCEDNPMKQWFNLVYSNI